MKLFVFDVETDGLYGDGFAVGAVVLEDGKEVARFSGIAEPEKVKNEWVRENVIPHLDGLTEFPTRKDMRNAFWEFWMKHRDGALCFADFGSPVESGFFRACVTDDPERRMWDGPYPLHEVGTLLLAAGIDPDIDRVEFSGLKNLKKHNPVDDALASAITIDKALSKLN